MKAKHFQTIINVMAQFMADNQPFSAHNVTVKVRETTEDEISHEVVRGFIHYTMEKTIKLYYGWTKDWSDDGRYIVYRPATDGEIVKTMNEDIKQSVRRLSDLLVKDDKKGCCKSTTVVAEQDTNVNVTTGKTYGDPNPVSGCCNPSVTKAVDKTELVDTRHSTQDGRVYLSTAVLKKLGGLTTNVWFMTKNNGDVVVSLRHNGSWSSRTVDMYGSAKVPSPNGAKDVEIYFNPNNNTLVVMPA